MPSYYVSSENFDWSFSVYIIESDTVKSDCPMQENYEIFKDLIQTVSFTVCSGYIK